MPRLKLVRPCLFLIATLWTLTASAQQQPSTSQAGQDVVAKTGSWANLPTVWTVTLGIEGQSSPSFYGAGTSKLDPIPVFSLRPEGKTARFRSIRDSSGIALFQSNGFFFGPVGRFQRARKEADHPDQLRGLGDVDWALEAGFFAEYWLADWFRTRAEVRRGFNGHEGFLGDLSADFIAPLGEKWSVSGGPRLSLADAAALRPYFGIDAVQPAASGLSAFDPKGGLKSAGVGGQVQYQLDKHWGSRAYVEYGRLLGDVAASPLVTERGSPNQVTFGAGLSYSFDYSLR
jgi:MipA family protein